MKGGRKMKHRKVIFISFLFLLLSFMCLFTFSQGVGYIQIKCEPGATVFLDNNFVGNTSSELGGLILQDVPAGSYVIKIVKEGFKPQSVKIDLKVNEIYVYEVKEFIPQLDVTQKGEADTDTIKQRVGSLLIETIPIDCIIEIPKLNINEEHYGDKTKKTWEISNIPVGSYKIHFIAMGKKLEYTCKIEEGIQKHLLVIILSNEVKEILPPPITYKVNFNVESGNGKLVASADGNLINSGDVIKEDAKVIFKATPDAGQIVKSWKVNGTKKSTNRDGIYIIEDINSDIGFKVFFDFIPYNIRDKGPAGGWIFYDKGEYTNGWRYLEAAPVSTEWKNVRWGSAKYKVGGTKKYIGSGKTNTEIIVKKQGKGNTYAAQLCDALVYGGYDDWFLPSRGELEMIKKNLLKFGVGNFKTLANYDEYKGVIDYWSSTENAGSLETVAWASSFSLTVNYQSHKQLFELVRAVRAF